MALIAVLALAGWIWLILFRGGFWRADQRLCGTVASRRSWPEVAVIIPARNESETIGQVVSSLLAQDYPGRFSIILVDDNSDDGTAAVAAGCGKISLVSGKALAKGWTGKLWAMSQGLGRVGDESSGAEYILFSDADIEHHPDNLRSLVAKAEDDHLDMVSLMVLLRCQSTWERLLIPAFVFFFQKLFPFPWVNDPNRPEAAAAGGCILVRLSALKRIGGLSAIKGRLIDDCAMAAEIKSNGAIWLGLGQHTHSLRAYQSLSEIWNMVARTASDQLDHSPFMLIGAVLGMMLIYIVPPVGVIVGIIGGDMVALSAALGGWLLMAVAYRPTLRLYHLPLADAALLPAAAFLYVMMTISSFIRHWRGRGGEWKGRIYDAR